MLIKLTLDAKPRGHGDMTLTVGDSVWRCDSYYLALDQHVLPHREDAGKVRLVLRTLLENWLAAVSSLASGAAAYLPYDFSDQGTAWLCCELVSGDVFVSHGWASVEGWSISPSEALAHFGTPRGFHPDAGPWRFSRDALIAGIVASIADAA